MIQPIAERLNEILEMTTDELIESLSPFLIQIMKNVSGALEEVPTLFVKLLKKLEQSDLPKLGKAIPYVFDEFMDIFWEGVSIKAATAKNEVASYLMQMLEDTTINFETFDTPLRTHVRVTDGKIITGGLGLVKFREQDSRWIGYTDEIFKLLRGEFSYDPLMKERLFLESFQGLFKVKPVPMVLLIGTLIQSTPAEA